MAFETRVVTQELQSKIQTRQCKLHLRISPGTQKLSGVLCFILEYQHYT